MSLDVYLVGPSSQEQCVCTRCDNVHTRTDEPWLYDANITHNLNQMADAAGIYQHLWRPDELGISIAGELVEPLRAGLEKLKADPAHFEQFNAPNGWGMYEHFVPFVEKYLAACIEHPTATVRVSR
jgi:hypothetical protein